MSFQKHQINLPKSSKSAQPLKLCNKCEEKKPPEGGIQMSPQRWICGSCWLYRKGPRK